jgi:hypothetical protein
MDEFYLDWCGSGGGNDFNYQLEVDWTEVMAMVVTISSTLQPRERSFNGLLIP